MSHSDYISLSWQDRDIKLEYQWLNADADGPLLIFLHEGLGSISMWRDWPAQLCQTTQSRGLVFSRYAYGRSTPRPPAEQWLPDFMHQQAWEVLPKLLEALELKNEKPVLIGHSDGASIALLYASRYSHCLRGLVAIAPHLFVEEVSLSSIALARENYVNTSLRERLARHHLDVDSAFWGWNDIWLHPEFKSWNIEAEVAQISCPILAVQGADDEYGTLEQIRTIQHLVPNTKLAILADCGHSPHRDQRAALTTHIQQFLSALSA